MLITRIIGVDKDLINTGLAIGGDNAAQAIVWSVVLECGEIVRKHLATVTGKPMGVIDCEQAIREGDLIRKPILKAGQEMGEDYIFKGVTIVTFNRPIYRGNDRAVISYTVH